MSDDLRARLIEAGARQSHRLMWGHEIEEARPAERRSHEAVAEVVLDAFLDCLAENASKWDLATAQRRWRHSGKAGHGIVLFAPLYVTDALAVLRESTDV